MMLILWLHLLPNLKYLPYLFLCLCPLPLDLLFPLVLRSSYSIHFLFFFEHVHIDLINLFGLSFFFPLVLLCGKFLVEDIYRATRQVTQIVELQGALLGQKGEVGGV